MVDEGWRKVLVLTAGKAGAVHQVGDLRYTFLNPTIPVEDDRRTLKLTVRVTNTAAKGAADLTERVGRFHEKLAIKDGAGSTGSAAATVSRRARPGTSGRTGRSS